MKFRLVEKFIKNPNGSFFGIDTCVPTAIAQAYDLDWNTVWSYFDTFIDLRYVERSGGIDFKYKSYVLDKLGYIEHIYLHSDEQITVSEFSKLHNSGVYLVTCKGTSRGREVYHFTCVKNGNIHDTFNCGKYIALDYYVIKE